MAFFRISNISQLKRIALKVTDYKGFCYLIVLDIEDKKIGVNAHLTNYLFRNNKPGTYYFENGVIVFIEDNNHIFVLPFCPNFVDILVEEKYKWDESISIPEVTTDSLKKLSDRIRWMFAMIFCNM